MEKEELLWTEKYRPKRFDEIIGQGLIVAKAKAFVEAKNLPHLLLAGPAGTGKSTLALVIARELYGNEWRQNFLELNASDERGIEVIRTKVKDFARIKPLLGTPFKIIFLDECDALTREAQQALRRTMENFASSCRFLMSCNYASKVIEPIQSRCVLLKFKPLSKEELGDFAKRIAASEGLDLSEGALKALVEVSEGDCRRLANVLQSCACLGKSIPPERVYELASVARQESLKGMLELALRKDFLSARRALYELVIEQGLAGIDLVKAVQKAVWSLELSQQEKLKLIEKCGTIEFRLVEGADDLVQLEALLAYVASIK